MNLKQSICTTLILSMISAPVMAQSNFENQLFEPSEKLAIQELSVQEMKATEGKAAPLVAVGIMVAGRFVIQKWVSQSVARSMVQSAGTNAARQGEIWGVLASTRSQAAAIAGKNGIREFHAGAGARYTHYHTNPRNGAHVWYGKPR